MQLRTALLAWSLPIIGFVACVSDAPIAAPIPPGADAGPDVAAADGPTVDAPLVCVDSKVSCNGTCKDISADKMNCGACGRACDDTCSNGRCSDKIIVSGLVKPLGFGIAGNLLLILSEKLLARCTKDGCPQGPVRVGDLVGAARPLVLVDKGSFIGRVLTFTQGSGSVQFLETSANLQVLNASTEFDVATEDIDDLVSDSQEVVRLTSTSVGRCIIGASTASGCGARKSMTLVDTIKSPRGVAITPNFYVIAESDTTTRSKRLVRCNRPAAGAVAYSGNSCVQRVDLGDNLPNNDLVVTNQVRIFQNRVYWLERSKGGKTDAIFSCSVDSGCGVAPTTIAAGDGVRIDAFEVDERGVYWVDSPGGAVNVCTDLENGCGKDKFTALAKGQTDPKQLKLDGSHLYFLSGGANAGPYDIRRVPR
jgi:hypothetical protein